VLVNRARSTLPTAEAQFSTDTGASTPLLKPKPALPELKEEGTGDDKGKKLADGATTEKDSAAATAHLPTRHPLSSSHEKARLRALQSKRWSCVKLASAAVMHFTALAHDNQVRQDAKDKEQKAAAEAAAAAAASAAENTDSATAAASTADASSGDSGKGNASSTAATASTAGAAAATGGVDSKKAVKVTPSTKLPALKQSGGVMSTTTRKLKKNGLGGIMDSFGGVVLKVRN